MASRDLELVDERAGDAPGEGQAVAEAAHDPGDDPMRQTESCAVRGGMVLRANWRKG